MNFTIVSSSVGIETWLHANCSQPISNLVPLEWRTETIDGKTINTVTKAMVFFQPRIGFIQGVIGK